MITIEQLLPMFKPLLPFLIFGIIFLMIKNLWNTRNRNKKTESAKVKGDKYELQISEYFKNQGYDTYNHGLEKGRKDKGIDIIIKKDNIYYLVQCKNYKKDTQEKNKIDHFIIRAFNGDCHNFIMNNSNKLNLENTKFLFVVSYINSLNINAIKYLDQNDNKCELVVIEYQE